MRSACAGGRRAVGAAGVVGLLGFASALLFAGGALGQLQLPTTTVTTPSLPTTTVTTPSVPVIPTTTVTTPAVPTTTVPTPRVTPPSPPPPPPPPAPPPPASTPRVSPPPPATPRVTPPSPPPALPKVTPPSLPKATPPSLPPPPVDLPKAPSAPKVPGSPAAPVPAIQAPPPPVGAPSLPTSRGAVPSGSPSPSAGRRSGGATGASAGAATAQSSGAAQDVPGRTSTTASAAGAAFGSSGSYRPSQEPPFLVGLPSSNAAALDYGAFIVPTGGAAARGLFGLGRAPLRAGEPNLLALLGFPDFLRIARAHAARRPGSELGALPDVNQVLGQQEALTDLGDGGGLTFGQLPLIALALVLVSSVLLVAAVLPPGVVARTPVSPASYARAREPLALAALGILVPVAVVALVVALS